MLLNLDLTLTILFIFLWGKIALQSHDVMSHGNVRHEGGRGVRKAEATQPATVFPFSIFNQCPD